MKKLTLVLILLVINSSFTDKNYGVAISFLNNTNQDFILFKANIDGKELQFPNLKKGKRTITFLVTQSYRYCYAEAITNRDTLRCQPDDYIGETIYTNGKILFTISTFPEKENAKCINISGKWEADDNRIKSRPFSK